jgi:hypothetical protein
MSKWPTGAVRQYHYYPSLAGLLGLEDGNLKTCSETGGAILGEFDAGGPADWKHTLWPEIPRAAQQAGGDIRVCMRLQLVESKGYKVALIWPDQHAPEGGGEGPKDTLKLSRDCQNGVKQYQFT